MPLEHSHNDKVLGSITVSEGVQHGTPQITIKVGSGMEILLSPSESQYASVRALLSDAIAGKAEPHKMLLPLAVLCAEHSIPQQVNIKDSSIALMFHRSTIPAGHGEAYRGIVAWVPEEMLWGVCELRQQVLKELSPALLLRLECILDSDTSYLNSRRSLLEAVADGCDKSMGHIDWYLPRLPASAIEPLIRLAAEDDVGAGCVPHIVRQALRAAKQDSRTLSESRKLTIVSAVQKITGLEEVFAAGGLVDWHPKLGEAIRDVLQLRERDALVACLHEIPMELAAQLPHSSKAEWVEHWDSFTEEAKAHLIDWVRAEPQQLIAKAAIYKIPTELLKVLASDGVIDKLLADQESVRRIGHRLGDFRALPSRACEELIKIGSIDNVLKNLSSFKLSASEKKQLLLDAIVQGKMDLLIPQLMSFPEKALEGIAPPGDQLLSFRQDSKLLLPAVYHAYREAYRSQGKSAAKQIAQEAWSLLGQLVSPAALSAEAREHPLFEDLMRYAYPNNGDAKDGSFSSCQDQSEDLELFEIPTEPQQLQLSGAVTMSMRRGLKPEPSVAQRIENLVREPLRLAESAANTKQILADRAQALLVNLSPESAEMPVEGALLNVLEQAMHGELERAKIKRAAVSYHAFAHPNFAAYAEGSRDRSESAPNKEYAHLLELREFLTTSVADSLQAAVRAGRTEVAAEKLLRFVPEIFTDEVEALDREIEKYAPHGTNSREARSVTAFFSKNEQSAAMRQVAGVCVAEDNPDPDTYCRNIWEMENYLQLVLRDESTRRCVGGVLLHYYEEQDKRILTASLNPSSTFLYKVDEQALFDELMRVIGDFADANDIDLVAVSRDSNIRTNRTGGAFEQALNTRIRLVNEQFTLDDPQDFSYRPAYKQQELDVVWRRGE